MAGAAGSVWRSVPEGWLMSGESEDLAEGGAAPA